MTNEMVRRVHVLNQALSSIDGAAAIGRKLGKASSISSSEAGDVRLLPCGHHVWFPHLAVLGGHCPHGCTLPEPTSGPSSSDSSPIGSPAVSPSLSMLSMASGRMRSGFFTAQSGWKEAVDAALEGEVTANLLAKLGRKKVSPEVTLLMHHFLRGPEPKKAKAEMAAFISAGMTDDVSHLKPYGVRVCYLRCSAWLEGKSSEANSSADTDLEGSLSSSFADPHGVAVAALMQAYSQALLDAQTTPSGFSLFFSESYDQVSFSFSYTNITKDPPPHLVNASIALPRDIPLATAWICILGKFLWEPSVYVPSSILEKWASALAAREDADSLTLAFEVISPPAPGTEDNTTNTTTFSNAFFSSGTLGEAIDGATKKLCQALPESVVPRTFVMSLAAASDSNESRLIPHISTVLPHYLARKFTPTSST